MAVEVRLAATHRSIRFQAEAQMRVTLGSRAQYTGAGQPMGANPQHIPTEECDMESLQLYTTGGHIRRLHEIEKDILRLAMRHYGGEKSQAAQRLGIGRSTLYRKLVDFRIDWENT